MDTKKKTGPGKKKHNYAKYAPAFRKHLKDEDRPTTAKNGAFGRIARELGWSNSHKNRKNLYTMWKKKKVSVHLYNYIHICLGNNIMVGSSNKCYNGHISKHIMIKVLCSSLFMDFF